MFIVKDKIINGLLISLLALGLTGCAQNTENISHKTASEPRSAKIAHPKSNYKSAITPSTTKTNSISETKDNSTSSQYSYSTQAAYSKNNAQSQSKYTTSYSNNITPTKSTQTSNDLAVWTDQYGIVHHVDSNNLDYQTIPGSVQVHYEDFTGQIPQNANIIHNAGPNIPQQSDKYQSKVQLGLGDVAVWTDQYGIVHHVDSDGMDRQTIPGSSQIHYTDWSGELPADAQVIHN